MGALIDKLFHKEKYLSICDSYEQARRDYHSGYEQFLRDRNISEDSSYEFKILVHSNLNEISDLNQVYTKSDEIRRRFPKGYEIFLEGKDKRSYNNYSVRKAVVDNKDDIEYKQLVYEQFQELILKYPSAIPALYGYGDSFEIMENAVNGENSLAQVEEECDKYHKRKNKYPYTIAEARLQLSLIDTIQLISSGISESAFSITEEYLRLKSLYTFVDYNELTKALPSVPESLDFSPEGLNSKVQATAILAEHQRKVHLDQEFKAIAIDNKEAVILSYSKPIESFSEQEKQSVIDTKDFMITVQEIFNNALEECEGHENWKQGLYGLVQNASDGQKISNIPDEIKFVLDAVKTEDIIEKYPLGARKYLMGENYSIYDRSQKAMQARSYIRQYEALPEVEDYHDFSASVTISERDTHIREILDSKVYGNGERFTDSYTLLQFYELQERLENNSTTFDDTYRFIISNKEAILAFNKKNSGKECYFTNDYDKVAQHDEKLFNFINEFTALKEAAEKAKWLQERYPDGLRSYMQQKGIADIASATPAQLIGIHLSSRQIADEHCIVNGKRIASAYRDAVEERFGPSYLDSISVSKGEALLNAEEDLKRRQSEMEFSKIQSARLSSAVSGWKKIGSIPFYFFFWYYPIRYTDVTPFDMSVRAIVYNFKSGRSNSTVIQMLEMKLRHTFSAEDLRTLTFVCIPASNVEANMNRYGTFSQKICVPLGMRNAFSHIRLLHGRQPSRLGGTEQGEYSYDEPFFRGAKVIIFDDIVTRGRSATSMANDMARLGASVICVMSIGQTYSDYYGDSRKEHPWREDSSNVSCTPHARLYEDRYSSDSYDDDDLPF